MSDPILRNYNMEDELMLVRSQTMKDNVNADLVAFTARFPWIVPAYLASWQSDIDTAHAFPLDNAVLDDQTVLTNDVNASMEDAKGKLRTLFLFAEITYPKDTVRQRVFGQNQMDKARNDQEKMMNLLQHAYSFAKKDPYKTDLLAKGYTQVEIDALQTLAVNIENKNRLQENAKSQRPVTTQDRTEVYNSVFDQMPLISTCAQVVYAGNSAKINQFRVYPPSSGQVTGADVQVLNTATNLPVQGVTVKLTNTALAAATTDAGGLTHFNLGTTPPPSVDVEVSGASIATQVFAAQPILDGEANFTIVKIVV